MIFKISNGRRPISLFINANGFLQSISPSLVVAVGAVVLVVVVVVVVEVVVVLVVVLVAALVIALRFALHFIQSWHKYTWEGSS